MQYKDELGTTPTAGRKRKDKPEAKIFMTYAIEQGGRIDLTPETIAELERRGLAQRRIPNAVYQLRTLYGTQIETVLDKKKATGYNVTL